MNDATREIRDLPPEYAERVAGLATAADQLLSVGHEAALAVSREEYELLLEAEGSSGRRLHKGHALHNIGAAMYAREPEEGRLYFHAAVVEDARTLASAGGDPPLAKRTLLDLYGERLSVIEQLEELALQTDEEPVALARRFTKEKGPFEAYHGIRAGWRDESELDAFNPSQLVFCGGSHAQPMGLKAVAAGARAAGFQPVVVIEFQDKPDDDRWGWKKSKRLLQRCGVVVFDVSDERAGENMEMVLAAEAGGRFLAVYIENDPLGPMHGSRLRPGIVEATGSTPRACRTYEEMEAEVRDWCRAHPISEPRSPLARLRGPELLGPQGSNIRIAVGSAHHDFNQQPVPSGSGYVPEEGTTPEEIAERYGRPLLERMEREAEEAHPHRVVDSAQTVDEESPEGTQADTDS